MGCARARSGLKKVNCAFVRSSSELNIPSDRVQVVVNRFARGRDITLKNIETALGLLEMDIRLNAQGLLVWLQRRGAY